MDNQKEKKIQIRIKWETNDGNGINLWQNKRKLMESSSPTELSVSHMNNNNKTHDMRIPVHGRTNSSVSVRTGTAQTQTHVEAQVVAQFVSNDQLKFHQMTTQDGIISKATANCGEAIKDKVKLNENRRDYN